MSDKNSPYALIDKYFPERESYFYQVKRDMGWPTETIKDRKQMRRDKDRVKDQVIERESYFYEVKWGMGWPIETIKDQKQMRRDKDKKIGM